ncbi:MAG: hypothetical protein DKM50_13155 [Candidatus Margulisiibacteriota bacterium]|nr:MAG: hypothetical protein A2X43_13840 [Candidatus Margulisbacteria bacterium GWD2_39_127]OGI05541.1 MAG: hypothetical protein A2X42_00610 [Candidatus Margulisbacteria bacterium GWF2_38_17]OGI08378.1 MAG: hypothetical protein A2X41_10730 [Candidatus Margulisbacteria bacterium GWE2_39_32]PZM77349.1 MAG: hypothetical protein DKM50_13155 [Candidatus Margulisiibacteriota bacterium]HAR63141.1 hypothetical protein [Candidatus Margulisiibacteriota bacterium]
MTFSLLPLLQKSYQLLRQDYSIVFPSIIIYFLVSIFSSFIKLKLDEPLQNVNSTTQLFIVVFSFVHIYVQTLIVAMGKSIIEENRIDFVRSLLLSLKKIITVYAVSLIILFPTGLLLVVSARLPVVQYVAMFLVLWFVVILLFVPIIVINDGLGIINTLRKLFLFIRLNNRTFFNYSFYFLGIMLVLFLINNMFIFIPYIGENLIFPVLQGLIGTYLVILTYTYYRDCNEKVC